MTTIQEIFTIIAVAVGTMLTRFLPFFIFPEGKKPPEYITYLGSVLPYAVIGLLVVYCLKDAFDGKYFAVPEMIAVLFIMEHILMMLPEVLTLIVLLCSIKL